MPDSQDLTMLLVGDVRVVRDDPPAAFKYVRERMRSADFMLGNLEGSMSDSGAMWPKGGVGGSWKSDARQIAAIESAGFNAMNVANNHAMDYGYEALAESMRHLDRLGVAHTGGGRTFCEAHAPAIVERKGCRVALLGYTTLYIRGWEVGPESPGVAVLRGGTAYEPAPKFFEGPGRPAIIHSWILPEDEAQLAADIAAARTQADIVICTFHWGVSGGFINLTEYQPALGRHAIDAGADLVFGHHPHVLQGIEVYKGRGIFYSLGNFVFDSKNQSPVHGLEKMIVRCGIRNKKINTLEYLPVLDVQRTPKVVPLAEAAAVIDVVNNRSAQFGTRFVAQGDAMRVVMGPA
jgi:poly-gamma-glutamate capsule biosynthesis protein CapA/YwtB (metallophosphatase superfamily)